MQATVVIIPTDEITDWDSFHSVFRHTLGFPEYYGCNMNAWVDCLFYVDKPDMLTVFPELAQGEVIVLRIDDVSNFQQRCPEQYEALLESAAFLNYARIEAGKAPILALMLGGYFNKP